MLWSITWGVIVLAFYAYLLHFTTSTVVQDPACSACPAAHQRNNWRTFVQLFLLLLVINAVCTLALKAAGGDTGSSAMKALALFTLLLMPVFVYAALRWTQELRKCACSRSRTGTAWLRALAIFDAVVLVVLALTMLSSAHIIYTVTSMVNKRKAAAK